MRNSGIRDIENVLGIHRDSVMSVIKAEADKIPSDLCQQRNRRSPQQNWMSSGRLLAQRRLSDGHGMHGIDRKNGY
jgi:hypothetical protein